MTNNEPPEGTYDVPATNLWEGLTHKAHCRPRLNNAGENVDDKVLNALAWSSRFSGQELSLEATKDGWEIKVFSCYLEVESEVRIMIPRDWRQPPTIQEMRP